MPGGCDIYAGRVYLRRKTDDLPGVHVLVDDRDSELASDEPERKTGTFECHASASSGWLATMSISEVELE